MASWKKVLVSGSAAQLASLTLDTALPVAQGGIGASSLTDKAVLISQDSGTDAIGAVALTSNGQLIIGGSDGPAAATLTGTSNEITVTNGANSITLSLPDDVTIGGDLRITDDVTSLVDINDMRDIVKSRNITNSGSIADSHITGSFTGSFTGDGSGLTGTGLDVDTLSDYGAQTLHQTQDNFLVSDNGTEKKIKFSDLEDSIFANISGDATVAGGGALTIAADSVSNSMLENMTQGTVKVGGGSNAPTDLDAKTDGQILVGDGTDINSVAVSGDIGLANNGAVTIQANAVEGSMLNSNVAGTGLDYGSNELSVDVSDFMTNGSNNRVVTATGTDGMNGEANLTFDGSTLVVNGNLEVAGTQTTVNSTNLLIEDKFILLNSGSNSGDGGLIVQTESAFSGSALVFDDSESRWGFQFGTKLGSTAVVSAPDAYASSVVTSDDANYRKNGNIRVQSDEIYIYVE